MRLKSKIVVLLATISMFVLCVSPVFAATNSNFVSIEGQSVDISKLQKVKMNEEVKMSLKANEFEKTAYYTIDINEEPYIVKVTTQREIPKSNKTGDNKFTPYAIHSTTARVDTTIYSNLGAYVADFHMTKAFNWDDVSGTITYLGDTGLWGNYGLLSYESGKGSTGYWFVPPNVGYYLQGIIDWCQGIDIGGGQLSYNNLRTELNLWLHGEDGSFDSSCKLLSR